MKSGKIATLSRRFIRRFLEELRISRNPGLCENIVGWALVRNWECKRIHEPFLLQLIHPNPCINSSSNFQRTLLANEHLGFPPQHLVVLPNVTVGSSVGFVVLAEGSFLCEGKWRVTNVTNHPYYRGECKISRVIHRHGDWLCAMGYFGGNYNHWLWDELPRITNALRHIPVDTRFLVSSGAPAFVFDSLNAIGIQPEKIVCQSFDEESRVERLWFPTPLGHSDWSATAPDVITSLQRQVWNWADADPVRGSRRLYISRSKASYRRAVNELEILQLLKDFGFETIYAEDLSWVDQVRCFAQAEAIVGIHGAGLTNMLFSPPGAVVVELHGPVSRLHYWNMANVCGHRYACVCSEGSSEHETPESDIQVDLIGLRQAVRQFYS